MSTDFAVTSEVTRLPASTNSSTSKEETEETEDSNLAIYISVPIVILILLFLAVIAVILIRRHKKHEEENTESEAVYSGNDMPIRKRSIPGIQNQAYCAYSIENKDKNKKKSDNTKHSNGIYRKTSHDSIKDLPKVVSYQNINPQSSNDLSNVSSYTYVTNAHGGFEVKSDVYSDVTFDDPNYYNDASEIVKITKGKLDTPKIGRGSNKEEVKSSSIGTDWSVYDHAMAGGADPDEARSDESFNLSKVQKTKERKSPARHSYVNVSNQNNHVAITQSNTLNTYDHIELADDQSPRLEAGKENSHLNALEGNRTASFPHRYENVKQGNNDILKLPTQRKQNGGYEDPVGITPNYFVIEQ